MPDPAVYSAAFGVAKHRACEDNGVDLVLLHGTFGNDQLARQAAREAGVACREMDFTSAIDFRDESFDVVMMTAVLEHLPYPSITVRE